jgi:hypothetical protein
MIDSFIVFVSTSGGSMCGEPVSLISDEDIKRGFKRSE